jgi:hypothetical protein
MQLKRIQGRKGEVLLIKVLILSISLLLTVLNIYYMFLFNHRESKLIIFLLLHIGKASRKMDQSTEHDQDPKQMIVRHTELCYCPFQ